MTQTGVHLPAVLAAGVLNMALGACWYSPLLFARRWLKLIGWSRAVLERRKKQGHMGTAYGVMFLASLAMAYTLAHLLLLAGVHTLCGGAVIGWLLGVGVVMTTSLGTYVFEGRPARLFLLNNGFHLVSFVVMGALLGAWR